MLCESKPVKGEDDVDIPRWTSCGMKQHLIKSEDIASLLRNKGVGREYLSESWKILKKAESKLRYILCHKLPCRGDFIPIGVSHRLLSRVSEDTEDRLTAGTQFKLERR